MAPNRTGILVFVSIFMTLGFVWFQCAQDRYLMTEGIERTKAELVLHRRVLQELKSGNTDAKKLESEVARLRNELQEKEDYITHLQSAPQQASSSGKGPTAADTSVAANREEVNACQDPTLPQWVLGSYKLKSSVSSARLACTVHGDAVCGAIRNDGVWEEFVFDAVSHALSKIDTKTGRKAMLFDMGGNVGAINVRVAIEGHVAHAFEMLPRNAQMIKTSKCLNKIPDDRLYIYHTGLGSVEKTCNMITARGSNDGIVDCSGRSAAELGEYKIDGTVKVKPLDSMWNEPFGAMVDDGTPNVVKIDVEGFEIDVLRGASKLLGHKNRPKLVLTEVWPGLNFKEYAQMMLGYGYVGFEYQERSWVGDMDDAQRYNNRKKRVIDTVAWVQPDYYNDYIRTPNQGGKIRRDREVWQRHAVYLNSPAAVEVRASKKQKSEDAESI